MEQKQYDVVVRDVNLNSGKHADEGTARLVRENPKGCLMTLPKGEVCKFVPIPADKVQVPTMMHDRYHPGRPVWYNVYKAMKGKTIRVTVESL